MVKSGFNAELVQFDAFVDDHSIRTVASIYKIMTYCSVTKTVLGSATMLLSFMSMLF